ncbi:hypothetical protein VTL71DRAFT_15665 [Oculimacula yallundae]|uniref:Uncharacterized protein n=1 Tax=Oculimacula yallundae TaxID=86028 RepID=A0ABR4CHZ5_9HELO
MCYRQRVIYTQCTHFTPRLALCAERSREYGRRIQQAHRDDAQARRDPRNPASETQRVARTWDRPVYLCSVQPLTDDGELTAGRCPDCENAEMSEPFGGTNGQKRDERKREDPRDQNRRAQDGQRPMVIRTFR